MKITKFLLMLLLSTSVFAVSDMKIELEKPLDNLIVINIVPDEDSDSWNYGEEDIGRHEYHRVKKGEYLTKIASIHDKKVKKLVKINEIKNPNLIFPKQKIYLNNKENLDKSKLPEYHIVQAGENIIEIAYYYEIDFIDIIRLNNLKNLVLYPNQKLKLKE